MEALSRRLMCCVAVSLGLPRNHFDTTFGSDPNVQLKIARYPVPGCHGNRGLFGVCVSRFSLSSPSPPFSPPPSLYLISDAMPTKTGLRLFPPKPVGVFCARCNWCQWLGFTFALSPAAHSEHAVACVAALTVRAALVFPLHRHRHSIACTETARGEHTDSGYLSLLLQDDTGGLEVRNGDGAWIPAPPVNGAFVVNLGEMLQLHTGGYYLATPHRVIMASGDGDGDGSDAAGGSGGAERQARISVPYFWNPRLDHVVSQTPTPLPATLPWSRPKPTDSAVRGSEQNKLIGA